MLWYFVNDAFLGFLYHHHGRLVALNRGLAPVCAGSVAYSQTVPRHLRAFPTTTESVTVVEIVTEGVVESVLVATIAVAPMGLDVSTPK